MTATAEELHQLFCGWLLLHPINGQFLVVVELPAVPHLGLGISGRIVTALRHIAVSLMSAMHAQQRIAAGEKNC